MATEFTPSYLTGATFRTVRKGYDPAEVDALLRDAAASLEHAQQQATAMEARARAAVTRLQEQTDQSADPSAPAGASSEPDDLRVEPDHAETISRTLLLAQRTADATVADAEATAERILAEARDEADATLESSRAAAAQIVDEARAEGRRANEAERVAAGNEVEALKARREFLLGDVDQLETFLIDQRERLRGAARQIEALCERVPSGLGGVAAPLLSASGDEPGDDTADSPTLPATGSPTGDSDWRVPRVGDPGETDPAVPPGAEADEGRARPAIDTGELDATQPVATIDTGDVDVDGVDRGPNTSPALDDPSVNRTPI